MTMHLQHQHRHRVDWIIACIALVVQASVSFAAVPEGKGRVQALTVAGFPADALLDGTIHMPNDGKNFVLAPHAAEASAALRAEGLAPDTFEISIQTLLVKANDRILLFDTGGGTNMGAEAGYLPASLTLAHVQPEQITDIFISHTHEDHIGGLITPDGHAAFPNATIHISKEEWNALKSLTDDHAAKIGIAHHGALIAAMTPKVAPFTKNTSLIDGVVKAVDVPGHTPGHSAYLIGSGPQSVLYIGDSLHHFVTSVRHPEWLIEFDEDEKLASRSRVTFEKQWADHQQLLFSPHFPFPGYGKIVLDGSSYRWVRQR